MNGPALPARERHVLELVAAYAARTPGSKRLAAEARPVLADKSSIGMPFTRETKEICYPLVVERAEGPYLWDVDGHRYTDILLGLGLNLFGHNPPFVREAIARQLERGFALGPQHALAGETARRVAALTGHERVCFSNTGTEAVMTALRIARAATGRACVVTFTNSYHGHHDTALMRAPVAEYARKRLIERWQGHALLAPLAKGLARFGSSRAVPAFPGVSRAAAREVLVLEYGHPRSLDVIRARAKDIAAVLVEPVQSRATEVQPREFLHALRALTERTGSVLVFDEMVTGFRVHPGGAQAHFGVQADLATYSKIAGGGLPLSVIAGRAQFMDRIDGGAWRFGDDSAPQVPATFFAGTFTKHPLALVAAHAMLGRLQAEGPQLQAGLNERTAALVARLNAFTADAGLPVQFAHFGSFFSVAQSRSRLEPLARLLLSYHLLQRGVHLRIGDAGGFLCTEHGAQHVEHIEQGLRDGLLALRQGTLL